MNPNDLSIKLGNGHPFVSRQHFSKIRFLEYNGTQGIFYKQNTPSLSNYRDRKDFFGIIDRVEKIIFVQKFEGAVTGIYNANIISRDLGLMDRKDLKHNIDPTATVHFYLPDNGRDKHLQEHG